MNLNKQALNQNELKKQFGLETLSQKPENLIERKKIADDIYLEKELELRLEGGQYPRYLFRLISKSLRVITFEVDFSGSRNLEFHQESSQRVPAGITTFTKRIEPSKPSSKGQVEWQSTLLVKVTLFDDWKLKSKFKFALANPSKEIQKQYIQHDKDKQTKEIKLFEKFQKYPFHLMTLQQISDTISFRIDKYYDLEFQPNWRSIYNGQSQNPLDVYVHWRRPESFLGQQQNSSQEKLHKIVVFQDTLEPSDIKPGILGDEWFLSAIAILAERPALIERLFLTREINPLGVYKIKLCKNGEWQVVTIDDLFPCYPQGQPLFSTTINNEIWVLLLEKAYAKIHGSYFQLKSGLINEALSDLTGAPSNSYDLSDEFTKQFIHNGQLWDLIMYFYDEGYLISFTSANDVKWNTNNVQSPAKCDESLDSISQEEILFKRRISLIPKGHAFSVILVTEEYGNKLLKFRSPLKPIKWDGDWCHSSSLWDHRLKLAIGKEHFQHQKEEQDMVFWMSLQEAVAYFKSLNVCRVRNWNEVRLKGKFLRLQDLDFPSIESVQSKWYYSMDIVDEETRIVVTVHQEDERIRSVGLRRHNIDVGIAVLRRLDDGMLELVELKDFIQERQVELDVSLEPGSYIILPRTTGCSLRGPTTFQVNREQIKLLVLVTSSGKEVISRNITTVDGRLTLSALFDTAVTEIFSRLDIQNNKYLSFQEFQTLCEIIERPLTENEWLQQILPNVQSTYHLSKGQNENATQLIQGITLDGLKKFFVSEIELNNNKEDFMFSWLSKLGYDELLVPTRSRCFMISVHSHQAVSIQIRDAIKTDIEARTNILIALKYGQYLESKPAYDIIYTFSEQILAYTYFVTNKLNVPIELILDFSNSLNMIYSSRDNKITKRIEPQQMEFMMHTRAMPNTLDFVRSVKITLKELRSIYD